MDKVTSSLDWSLMQAFLAVAETGSLSQAARLLGASQPTLGRQIRRIEADLGLALFTRQPRGLVLTETGRALVAPAERMRDAMREIALTAAGKENSLEGPVRITTSDVVAHHILPPIIAEIRRAEPEISIDLVPTNSSENLLFREADIAVRMYRSEQLDVITRHLGDIALGIFAAKSYLARKGHPETAAEFMAHDFVGYDRSELIVRGMRDQGWDVSRDWFKTRCDSQTVYWELVRAGCGIGFFQRSIAESDPLVEEIDLGFTIPPLPVWLAAHRGMRQTPRIRRVWDMLADGMKPFVS